MRKIVPNNRKSYIADMTVLVILIPATEYNTTILITRFMASRHSFVLDDDLNLDSFPQYVAAMSMRLSCLPGEDI